MSKSKKLTKPQKFLELIKPNSLSKGFFSFALLFALIGGGYMTFKSFAASGAYLYLNPSSATVYPQSTFDVQIWEQSGTRAVNAVQSIVTYPSDKLSYVSTSFAYSSFSIVAQSSHSNGSVSISNASTTPRTGAHLVAIIRFKFLVSSSSGISVPINFGPSSQILASSSPPSNIIGYTQGATFLLKNPPSLATYMYLTPTSGSYSIKTTHQIALTVIDESGLSPINVFQPVVSYPTNLLSYDHATFSSPLSLFILPSINNGVLTLTGGIIGGQLSGPHNIATIYFNVKSAGNPKISLTSSSAMINALTSKSVSISHLNYSQLTINP